MQTTDEGIAVLIGKGSALTRADLLEVDFLLTQGDHETAFERRGWTYEAIALIVADPGYAGDITMEDLDKA